MASTDKEENNTPYSDEGTSYDKFREMKENDENYDKNSDNSCEVFMVFILTFMGALSVGFGIATILSFFITGSFFDWYQNPGL